VSKTLRGITKRNPGFDDANVNRAAT